MHHQFEKTKNSEEPSLHYIIYIHILYSNIQSSINDWNFQKPVNFELSIEIFSGILPRNCHDVKEFHGPGLVDHAGRKVQPGRSQKGRIHDGFIFCPILLMHYVSIWTSPLKFSWNLRMNSKYTCQNTWRSFPTNTLWIGNFWLPGSPTSSSSAERLKDGVKISVIPGANGKPMGCQNWLK